MNLSEASQVVAGLVLSGRCSPDAVDITALEPPYDALVRGKKDGKEDFQLVQSGGMEAFRTACIAADSVPEGQDVSIYLDLLKRTAVLYRTGSVLQRLGGKMLRGEDVELSTIHEAISKMESRELEFVTLDEVQAEQAIWEPTYWPAIDEYMGGLPAYGLVLVGGSPGGGKTSAVVKLIDSMTRRKLKTGLFTLEVTNAIIKYRWSQIRPDLPAGQARLCYSCDINYSLDEVCSAIARLVSQVPDIYCIFIDFADLMVVQESTENASEIYIKLAMLAKKLRKRIVLLCQLSRKYTERGGGQPRVTDIRWSGLAEAMATMILLIYNPDQIFSDQGSTKGVTSLPFIEGRGYIIEGKSRFGYRMGGPGAVSVDWGKETGWGHQGLGWEQL